MIEMFENENNPSRYLSNTHEENTDITKTVDAKIVFLKSLLQETEKESTEQEKNKLPPGEASIIRIKFFKAILEDLYDQKYIGAPVHKQKQLYLFQNDNSPLFEPINNNIQKHECVSCGWIGFDKEKHERQDEPGLSTSVCPKCGHEHFYLTPSAAL